MAASMIFRSSATKNTFTIQRRFAHKTYYVLLPEVPPDTPETNPIMRVHDHPRFSAINPDSLITGNAKLSIMHDVEFGKHVENLKDPNYEKSFNSVFEPLEKISVPLNYAWKTAKTLSYVHDGKYKTAFQRIHPQVARSKNERWISEPLYNAVKEVSADRANLTRFQNRVVDTYLLEARLNGIELAHDDKKTFINILNNLVQFKSRFRNRVMLSHNMFSHILRDTEAVSEMPKQLLNAAAVDQKNPTRGPWKITLNQHIYEPFLEYCSDRTLRWNLWHAYNNRASADHDQQNLSNHGILKDIRLYRKDLAEKLGYENYAELSMETKMAGSVDNVLGMLDGMKNKVKPVAAEELAELQEFAISEGFQHKLDHWDIPYWRRRQRQNIYKLELGAEAEYFPLPTVLKGLFDICKTLFDIDIKDCTGEVDVWHEDMSFYRITDSKDGHDIASFYLDPYARPEKLMGTWMEAGREHSTIVGTKPVSFLNMSVAPPFGNRPALLNHKEIVNLFYEFGHGLQQMLTTVDYSEIAGQRNIEWDALQVCAFTMSMFAKHPSTLASISGHYQTGQKIPQAMLNTLLQSKKHMQAYDLIKELYLGALDMEFNISSASWGVVMQNIWESYLPLTFYEDDNHPCSQTEIFSDQYTSAYYSFVWADMLASDIFKSFDETGLENLENAAPVGRRFRDTFLSLGGGLSANEIFRQFRGRDPSQQAFFKYKDLS